MGDVNVGIGVLLVVCRKHCIYRSDGVGSEGEVDVWL